MFFWSTRAVAAGWLFGIAGSGPRRNIHGNGQDHDIKVFQILVTEFCTHLMSAQRDVQHSWSLPDISPFFGTNMKFAHFWCRFQPPDSSGAGGGAAGRVPQDDLGAAGPERWSTGQDLRHLTQPRKKPLLGPAELRCCGVSWTVFFFFFDFWEVGPKISCCRKWW